MEQSNQDLESFNELRKNITEFVAPALQIAVVDFRSAQGAVDTGKALKTYMSELEAKRKLLVKPLNDQVDRINEYVKTLKEPMLRAEGHIKGQIATFETAQEKIRQEAHKRAEAERMARERVEAEERAKVAQAIESERLARLQEVESAHQEASDVFGAEDSAELEAARAQIAAKHDAERLALEIRETQERAIATQEAKARASDIEQMGVKNVRKTWKCEVVDIDLVPKEFLIRTLNTQAVLAAARGGVVGIPGVRLWQEMGVALGRNSYVPRSNFIPEGP